MASVTLVRDGVELVVTTPRAFVSAVYAQGWVPKTGSVADNYEALRGAPPPLGGISTLGQLAQRLVDVEARLAAGGGGSGGGLTVTVDPTDSSLYNVTGSTVVVDPTDATLYSIG